MVGQAGLLIDLGNSGTRYELIHNGKHEVFQLSNEFAEIPNKYRMPREYLNSDSTVFEQGSTMYANGKIVRREFREVAMRPVSMKTKTEQLVSSLTLRLVFIHALRHLAEEMNCSIDSLDIAFKVDALLPPTEEAKSRDKLVEMIKEIKSVHQLYPKEFTVPINVSEVEVYAEGVVAYIGAMYDDAGGKLEVVEENKDFDTGNVLIFDIGAGTFDIATVQDAELLSSSLETFKFGCNKLASLVSSEVRKAFGVSPMDIEEVISTGMMTMGGEIKNVSEILLECKNVCAKNMLAEFENYQESAPVPIPYYKAVLTVGGGSLASAYNGKVTSPALADVLVDRLKEQAPSIRRMSTHGIDPRMLNLHGLRLLHTYY